MPESTKKAQSKKTSPKTSSEAKTSHSKKTAPKAESKTHTKEKKNESFAVISTGGKQYRVMEGDTVKVEKVKGDIKEGDKITFDKVLLVDDGDAGATIGTPFISGAKVLGTLKKIGKGKTIEVIKYKQKSRYFKKNGHRQPYFEVKIDSIK